MKCPEKRGVDLELLTQFCDVYGSPVLFGSVEVMKYFSVAEHFTNLKKKSFCMVYLQKISDFVF